MLARVPRGLGPVWTATRRAVTCALAAFMGCVSLPAIATGTVKRHRNARGYAAQKRRVFRRLACSGESLVPEAANVAVVEDATLCLINEERAAHGLAPLLNNHSLDVVATNHSSEMVSRDYFSHRSPSGSTPATRILTSGYVGSRGRVAVGENVATAGGGLATPASVVRGWMASPLHRANILRRGYRASGVGIALGMPLRLADGWAGPAATYTQDLGSYK